MKLKVKAKHGKWGFPLSFAPIVALLGYVAVLAEPLQAKYAGNHLESPSITGLVIATLLLTIFASGTSFLAQGLLGVKEEAASETDVDTEFTFKRGGLALLGWTAAWLFAFSAISIVWYGQL
jgi:hypothetical protein